MTAAFIWLTMQCRKICQTTENTKKEISSVMNNLVSISKNTTQKRIKEVFTIKFIPEWNVWQLMPCERAQEESILQSWAVILRFLEWISWLMPIWMFGLLKSTATPVLNFLVHFWLRLFQKWLKMRLSSLSMYTFLHQWDIVPKECIISSSCRNRTNSS